MNRTVNFWKFLYAIFFAQFNCGNSISQFIMIYGNIH